MKMNKNTKNTCTVCGGHKQLIAIFGNQEDDFVLADCPCCNHGNLVYTGEYWTEPETAEYEDKAPHEDFIFTKLPYADKVTPEYIRIIKRMYSRDIVEAYISDMQYYLQACPIEEWMDTTIRS